MNKVVVYENSYAVIDDSAQGLFGDLIDIGYQIKNELGLMYSPIQSVSAKKVYIGNIVGNLSLNTTNLIILPKYASHTGDEPSDNTMKRLYTRTLKCASENLGSTIFFYRNNTIDDQNDFFDNLAQYYLDITREATKKSKICLYEDRIEKVTTIKGRILVQKQLSSPVLDEKTWCKFRRLSDNNIYNQLIGWCCKHLAGMASNFDIKRKLLALAREFPQQIDLLNVHDVTMIKVPRQFSEYNESISLARSLYLEDCGKKQKLEKGNRICGYAINMERSFENIICYYSRIAAHLNGCRHKAQATKQLSASPVGVDYSYDVRPDDLISKGPNILILDAKYKMITTLEKGKKKPSRDDFYQMVSTCIAYDCHEAVLIYPETEGFPRMTWKTDKQVNGSSIIVHAESVSLDTDDDMLIRQISRIVKYTQFFKEVTNG